MADIKSRLQLDGEQEYKKALNDAYRSLRVLRSELKAETAEMGKNATAQDKASKKADSLKKQIEQQKKIVETLKKALADSRKEYADNQEVQDKWAEKLNKAREQLANMQNQMKTAQDTMHGFGDAMKDVADSSGEAAQGVVSINDCLKSIGSIAGGVGNTLSSIFTSTVDTMKAMVDEMYSLMGEAWAAAGDWKQIQTVWGGDLESIERVMMGAQMQGVDPGEITGGIQKLVTNTHNGNKETIAALKQLGIDESQFANHWDFFMATMQELTTRHGGERFDLATALFGDKKGSGMTDVIDNWNGLLDKFNTNAQGTGLMLTSPEIEQLDEVAHKIQEIKGMWEMIRINVGAKLSDILNIDQMSDDVLNILRDVGKIMNGDTSPEITITLEQHLNSLLETIATAVGNLSEFTNQLAASLQNSTNPVLKSIGDLLASLSGVFKWISDNSDTIIDWLNKMLPFMIGNKVLEATTGQGIGGWADTLGQLGIGVAEISLLGKAFGKSAADSIGAGSLGAAMGSGFGTALMEAVPWLIGLATLLTPGSTDADEMNSLADFYKNAGTLEEYVEKMTRNGAMSAEAAAAQYKNMEAILSGSQGNSASVQIAETTADKLAPYVFSNPQILAAQNYWDAFREGSDTSDEWDALRLAFEGDTEVLNKLVEKITQFYETDPSSTFLPASLFNSISGNNKNLELKTTNQITVNVNIDGETVQRNVSEHMAKNLMRLVGA